MAVILEPPKTSKKRGENSNKRSQKKKKRKERKETCRKLAPNPQIRQKNIRQMHNNAFQNNMLLSALFIILITSSDTTIAPSSLLASKSIKPHKQIGTKFYKPKTVCLPKTSCGVKVGFEKQDLKNAGRHPNEIVKRWVPPVGHQEKYLHGQTTLSGGIALTSEAGICEVYARLSKTCPLPCQTRGAQDPRNLWLAQDSRLGDKYYYNPSGWGLCIKRRAHPLSPQGKGARMSRKEDLWEPEWQKSEETLSGQCTCADPCSLYKNCAECVSNKRDIRDLVGDLGPSPLNCGWCEGTCASGSVSGPLLGQSCNGEWLWRYAQCYGKLDLSPEYISLMHNDNNDNNDDNDDNDNDNNDEASLETPVNFRFFESLLDPSPDDIDTIQIPKKLIMHEYNEKNKNAEKEKNIQNIEKNKNAENAEKEKNERQKFVREASLYVIRGGQSHKKIAKPYIWHRNINNTNKPKIDSIMRGMILRSSPIPSENTKS